MAATGTSITYPVKVVAELPWAWEHLTCGRINRGRWRAGAGCAGCGVEVHGQATTHLYLLIDAEPESEEN